MRLGARGGILKFSTVLKKSIFTMALAGLVAITGTAQARSGRASYHYFSGAMITASRYEPVGSVLRVTNPQNGRAVTVRVAGSGPFNGNRILDLSTGAFSKLYGGLGRGHGPVSYTVLSRGGGGGLRLASRGGHTRGKVARKHRHHR